MKRVTFEGNFCDIAKCHEIMCPYGKDCSQKRVWERLKHYEDMEEQGRLVVLPCKVGGTVWMIVTKRPKVNMPEYSFIKRSRLTWFNMERVLRCFGKTVFLAREEAEQALKEGN